ncbi:unnamed protein product [Rhizophagus irregularis]|nr:unnamed protein product [Rhizophagus irregularis]
MKQCIKIYENSKDENIDKTINYIKMRSNNLPNPLIAIKAELNNLINRCTIGALNSTPPEEQKNTFILKDNINQIMKGIEVENDIEI